MSVPAREPGVTQASMRTATACDTDGAGQVVDVDDFDCIKEAMVAYDETREKIIKESRDVQKLSKQAIYSLHRKDFTDATKKLKQAEEIAQRLAGIIAEDPTLRYGSFANALEEWAEGMVFKVFLQEGRIPKIGELSICERDEYLGGVLDFTGELNRYAIARATDRDVAAVKRCASLIDTLMICFLKFDFRNGSLRKKFDSLKYTLKKLENTLYELSLTENLGFKCGSTQEDGEAAGDKDDEMRTV